MLLLLVIGFICIIIVAPDILFWPILFGESKKETSSAKQGTCPVSEIKNTKKEASCKSAVWLESTTTISGNVSGVDDAFSSISNTFSSCSWNSWDSCNDSDDEYEDNLETEIYDEAEEEDYWMEDECIPSFELFDDNQNDGFYDDWDRYEDNNGAEDITYFFNGVGEPMTCWDGNGNFSGGPFSGI